jgi:hypothetical protein
MKRIVAALSLDLVLLLSGWCGTAAAQTPTTVSVRLLDTLSSENSKAGDRFTATLAEPLVINGRIVARKDTRVTGQVRDAVSSGRMSRPALLTLSLEGVQSRSGQYPIATGDLTVKSDSHAKRNVLIIGGSSGAGAAIGGAAGGGKGAVIGALIGAGAGTAGAYLTGKREIVLPAETLLTFHVSSVTISPKELARLQPAEHEAESSPRTSDVYVERDSPPVVVLRRHRGEDEDEDDDDQGEDHRGASEFIFTEHDRILIVDWFRENNSDLPPGLAKRDRLPPGLEKQLRERGTLPPGLQKRVQPLPYELERELHPLPVGYRRGFIGGSVIIMNEETSVIYAIFRSVNP